MLLQAALLYDVSTSFHWKSTNTRTKRLMNHSLILLKGWVMSLWPILAAYVFTFRYLLFTDFNGQCDFEGQEESQSVFISPLCSYPW